jgi:hypothetical protein
VSGAEGSRGILQLLSYMDALETTLPLQKLLHEAKMMTPLLRLTSASIQT